MMPTRQSRLLLGEGSGDGLESPDVPGEGEAVPAGALLAGLDGVVLPGAVPAACVPWRVARPAFGFPVAPVPGAVPVPTATVTITVVPGGTGACGATKVTVPAGCPVLAEYSTR
jgi:hypothetical protein